jgi:hypothetical protein
MMGADQERGTAVISTSGYLGVSLASAKLLQRHKISLAKAVMGVCDFRHFDLTAVISTSDYPKRATRGD